MGSTRILFATPEIDDFVRVGGLAAVSAALPRALRLLCDVRIVIPGYRDVLRQLRTRTSVGSVPAMNDLPACDVILTSTADGLPVYVIECPSLFDRPGNPYGDEGGRNWADNDVRFARFSSAVALLASGAVDADWRADVVHANDWPCGLIPAYLSWMRARTPSILTIHNLAYQGLFPRQTLRRIGAPDSSFQIDGLEFYNQVSFLKAGLIYANHLTTVSATYAREITLPEHGCGLDGVLSRRFAEQRLTGIINGIDESWDPRSCRQLSSQFAAGQWRARQRNADYLRRRFDLAVSQGPLFGLVARLVHQKGVDLVLSAAETIVASGGQIVVMGRGERAIEKELEEAQRRHPRSIRVEIGFDEAEARRIFAGSDFTLMPSRFEPCGLSQMYAQRFGSLPIGMRTGGLADTIVDGKTGFLFQEPSTSSFLGAVCRAFGTFGVKRRLESMRTAAMNVSFGWKQSVDRYLGVYRSLLPRRL
jgi:starch synthase